MEHLVLLVTTTVGKVAQAVGFSWWGDAAGAEAGQGQRQEEEEQAGGGQGPDDHGQAPAGGGEEIELRLLKGTSTTAQVARTGDTAGEVLRRAFGEEEGGGLRLLYLGRVLSPQTRLASVNAENGSTFHVVRGSAEAASQAAQSSHGRWFNVPDDVPPFDPTAVFFLFLSGVLLLYFLLFLEGNLREWRPWEERSDGCTRIPLSSFLHVPCVALCCPVLPRVALCCSRLLSSPLLCSALLYSVRLCSVERVSLPVELCPSSVTSTHPSALYIPYPALLGSSGGGFNFIFLTVVSLMWGSLARSLVRTYLVGERRRQEHEHED